MSVNMKGRSLLTIHELSLEEVSHIFELSHSLKAKRQKGEHHRLLEGKKLGMIFSKPSTRTRVSFEVGIYELGGIGLYFNQNDLQLKKSENISDTAKVLSRYLDGIMIRTFDHQDVVDLATYGSIPIINGLTDLHHPCQVLADLFTIEEKKGKLKGLKLAYIGDGNNNMAHSILHGCAKVGMNVAIASPSGDMPLPEVVAESQKDANMMGSSIEILEDPIAAVKNADIVYTDVWASMGTKKRLRNGKHDL